MAHLSDGIVVLGPDLTYRYLNGPAATMLDRTPETLLGKHIWTEFPAAAGTPLHAAFDQAMEGGEPEVVVEYYPPLERWFENRIFPREDGGVCVVFRDVSDRRRAREELGHRADRLTDAERIMGFGSWSVDRASEQVRWSPEMERLVGLEPGAFDGTIAHATSFVHPEDRELRVAPVQASIESGEPFVFEQRVKRADGAERVLRTEGRPVIAPDGSVDTLVGICRDVTDRTLTERALGASERRTRAIIDNTPSVITVKDLSGRYVMANDEAARVAGVPVGDLIGKHCEEVFPADVAAKQRANDQLAATEGEPVFDEVVLFRDGEPRTFVTVTFSLPDETGTPSELCTIATDVTDSQERELERLDRISWHDRIKSALSEGRMRVFAQPIVDLLTGATPSNELLVRMMTPGASPEVLPPGAFLPAAERFGLIQQIDSWMVTQALGLPAGSVSWVNLSAVTLCDPSARREIVELLGAAPEAATGIIFEITETAVAEHLDSARAFAADVTALGCRLALDDFGTGFGSLTYLHTLPLSFIKIDLSFIRALAESPEESRLVESIIEIGRVFGLKTIAEGVEDADMLERLRELGADYAQGYHLGRPAPIAVAA